MMGRQCAISGPSGEIQAGTGHRLVVIAGPCVLEDLGLALRIGQVLRDACEREGLGYVFKASFDKANRTSVSSPRGPGLEEGLGQLAQVRSELGVSVTTDVHEASQADAAAEVVDVLQVPAFLCRQSDLLSAVGSAAARFERTVNVKKGQFLSPLEMRGPVEKVRAAGCERVMVTERGTFFGYHRLVNDLIGLGDLLELDVPSPPAVCFDCTHSVQLPGTGATTGGRRERVPLLARAATAAGVDLLFFECHPEPERSPSDSSNMLALDDVGGLLAEVARIRRVLDGA